MRFHKASCKKSWSLTSEFEASSRKLQSFDCIKNQLKLQMKFKKIVRALLTLTLNRHGTKRVQFATFSVVSSNALKGQMNFDEQSYFSLKSQKFSKKTDVSNFHLYFSTP